MPVGIVLGAFQPSPQKPVTRRQFKAIRGIRRFDCSLDGLPADFPNRFIGIEKKHPGASQSSFLKRPVPLFGDQERSLLMVLQHLCTEFFGLFWAPVVAAGIDNK